MTPQAYVESHSLSTVRHCTICLFLLLLALARVQASDAVFTSPTTILATDTAYEGFSITVQGCSVTVEGTHSFGDLIVLSMGTVIYKGTNLSLAALSLNSTSRFELSGGAVLSASSGITVTNASTLAMLGTNTTGMIEGQWRGVGGRINASSLVLSADSVLSADGQGYVAGQGPGGSSQTYTGGTYGGRGRGSVLLPYGSAEEPVDLGSGGGGGAGGGAIRLNVSGVLELEGTITANGVGAGAPGGGSGGSIWVSAGELRGSGHLAANGFAGPNGGGGGRIAVYYGAGSGFAGYETTTASGGVTSAEHGTAGFFDMSVAGYHLRVLQRYVWLEDTVVGYGALSLGTGAVVRVGGGSTMNVAGDLVMGSNAVMVVEGKNRAGQVGGEWVGVGVTLNASNVVVAVGGWVTADGQGYVAGQGPGGSSQAYTGGTYGGRGQASVLLPYGSAEEPVDLGSGGGGGAGGGAIRLNVSGVLELEGAITANGAGNGALGGGSGGSIWVSAVELRGGGRLAADGYAGPNGGGGGRIAVYYATNGGFSGFSASSVSGGGAGAEDGTLYVSSTPLFMWQNPIQTLMHGQATLAWAALAIRPDQTRVDVFAARGAARYPIVSGGPALGSATWDTRVVPDGQYELTAFFYDPDGQRVGETSHDALVNNSVEWHGGLISANETWSPGKVHVVESAVTVGPGLQLTLEPGVIVKFAKDSKISLANGSALNAVGADAAHIVLTSLADDSAGGDSNHDSDWSVPQPGDWLGFFVQGSGQLNLNEFAELRYITATHTGALSASQTWLGSYLHQVTGHVTVPAGVTLAIEPGAVVKLGAKLGITVEAGGRLIARGLLAQPIVFTSIRDDAVGGDTNRDGEQSSPSAGDWGTLYANGGGILLDHVQIAYGAGTVSGSYEWGAGALRTTAGASLQVANSVIRDSAFEAIAATSGGQIRLTNCVISFADRAVNADGAVVTLVNSTLYKNRIGLWPHGGTINAYNTIISHSFESGISGANIVRYCDVWSPTGSNGSFTPGSDGNISADPLFQDADAGNFRLGFRSPCIDAADGTVAGPTDFMGAPRYSNPRQITKTGQPASDGAYPDLGAFECVEGAQSDLDLIVVDVVGPATLVAGESAVVTWEVRNIGTAPVSGAWHDAILLVPLNPGAWDEELEVAEVLSTSTLGPNQSTHFTARVRVPGGTEGPWRWRVKVNSRGEVFEGTQWNNNTGESAEASELWVAEVGMGTPHSGAFVSASAPSWFKVTQPSNADLSVTLTLVEAQNRGRICVGYGRMPTAQQFDQRSQLLPSPLARVALPASDSDRPVYLLLAPESSGAANLGFTLRVEVAQFGIESVGVTQVGNAGPVTIPIQGAQLGEDLVCVLRPASGGPERVATAQRLVDSTALYATFDLGDAPVGLYHVVLQRGAVERVLLSALTVTTGTGGRLETRILVPTQVRRGRPFTGYVEYRNAGDADLPAPLLFLEGLSGTLTVREKGSTNDLRSLNFLGVAQDTPLPSLLIPGAVYALEFQATATASASFSLSVLTVGDAGMMDYATLEQGVRPTVPHELWPSAWASIIRDSGATRGEYVAALGRAATRARDLGLSLITEQELLRFLVREAAEAVQDANVRGTVYLQDTWHPLAQALVSLRSVDDATGVGPLLVTTTWYDGTFGFRGVPVGTYELTVDSYLPTRLLRVVVVNPAVPVVGLNAILDSKAARVFGHVTDGEQGPPVLNGRVSLRSQDTGEVFGSLTDTNGFYEIRNLVRGTYELTMLATGWAPLPVRIISLREGEALQQSGVLSKTGGWITGYVRSSNGDPVPDAWVVAQWEDTAFTLPDWRGTTTRSQSDGTFRLTALPLGRYAVAASATGIGESLLSQVTVTRYDQAVSIDLTVQPGASVVGWVIDDNTQNPIGGARVTLDVFPPREAMLISDAAGYFEVAQVAVGSYQLWVSAPGYVPTAVPITVTPTGAPPTTVRLERFGSISGVVSDHGRPLPGMRVILLRREALLSLDPLLLAQGGMQYFESVTDALGGYRFADMPEGDYSIAVGTLQGLSQGRHDFALTAANLNPVFDFALGLSSITGRVYQVNGATPIANAQVFLVAGTDILAVTHADAAGSYQFQVYQTGTYGVGAWVPEAIFAPVTNVILTTSGDVARCDLVAPANSARFAITHQADGAAATNAMIRLRWLADPTSQLAYTAKMTDAAGQCVFDQIPSGSFEVELQAPGCALRKEVVAINQSPAQFDFAMEPGRRLHGQVRSAAGVLGGVRLDLLSATGQRLLWGLTSPDGHYQFTSAPAGVFSLAAAFPPTYEAVIRSNIDLTAAMDREEDLLLNAASSATIAGVVRDAAGNRVTGATIVLETPSGVMVSQTQSDNQGAYQLSGWPAGSYHVAARAAGYREGQTPVTTVAGVSSTGIDVAVSYPLAVGSAISGSGERGLTLAMNYDLLSSMKPWRSIALQGSPSSQYGIPHPSSVRDNYNYDFMRDVFQPWWSAYQNGRSNCRGVYEAYMEAKHWDDLLNRAYNDWCAAYENMRNQNNQQAAVVIAKGTLVAAKATKFMMSCVDLKSVISGKLKDPSYSPWGPETTKILEQISSTLDSIMGFVAIAQQAAAEGKLANSLDVALQSLGSELGALSNFLELNRLESSVLGGLSIVNDAYGLIKDFTDYMKEAAALGENKPAFDYLNASYAFHYAMLQCWKAKGRMLAAIADCKTGNGTNPNPPPKPPEAQIVVTTPTTVVASADPNDKTATGAGAVGYLAHGAPIYYVIHFENMSTASAAAQMVQVADRLPALLDWSSLELGEIGFNGVVVAVPGGLTHYVAETSVATDPNPVRVTGDFNPATGLVSWTLESVDRVTGDLPDDPFAGFLPPNDAAHHGEGYVSFSIHANPNLTDGLQVTNGATIVFDYNPPIVTSLAINTIDTRAPSSEVQSLPASSPAAFRVQWSGSDAGGSGVAAYDIYVSRDGGVFTLWRGQTAATSAEFVGQRGATYAFFSVASDAVGNREPLPAAPDAVTTVVSPVLQLTALPVTNGVFAIQVDGDPGQPFTLEYLADLNDPDNWKVLLTTNRPPPFILLEMNAASPQRFYRAWQPQ